MPRPIIFIDLAGTLIVHDRATRRWGAWTGVAGLLHDLAIDHDLHLTTGDSDSGARNSLEDLDVFPLFSGIHASLPGGGKPFGSLASALGVPPERCLVLGDDPISDTAGDTDRTVSVLLRHETGMVTTERVRDVIKGLAHGDGFLAGFENVLAQCETEEAGEAPQGVLDVSALAAASLGGGCRLGWWRRFATSRRAVVVIAA